MAEISSTSEEPTPSAAAATAVTPDATPKKKGSVADRVAWLQNAFNKDKDSNTPSKRDIGLESSTTSVSDRKRWMEEEAFRKHLEERGMDTPSTSHASVVAERRRWLDEQAERNRLENEKNQINSKQQPQQGMGSPARGGSGNKDNKSKEDDAANDDKEEATSEHKNPEDETNEAEPPLVEEAGVSVDEEVLSAAENDSDKEKAVEAPSKPSRPSSQDPPIQTTASTMMRATETAGTGGSAMPCLFSSPVFAQQRDQMEFFLPAACSCPKCRAELAAAAAAAEENGGAGGGGGGDGDTAAERADPTSLKTILRPWQVEFLTSQGITTAQALVNIEKDAESRQKLCKQMKRWRKERDLPAKTISCLMACRIWAKTSEEALKNAK